jgi:hypothetical protein
MNQTGLFEAQLETPAAINPWFLNDLIAPDSGQTYAESNTVATIGLAAGFDPDGYARAVHHPDNFKGCCNFFNGPGTFDFIDTIDEARFSPESAESNDFRRETYDELWPEIATTVGNTFIDFAESTGVTRSRIQEWTAFPDRRFFLTWSLWAPFAGQVSWIASDME